MNRPKLGLDQRPEDVDFADIVNQSKQSPLYIHFTFGAQGEAVHVFMHANVRKDRFQKLKARKLLLNRADSQSSGARFVRPHDWQINQQTRKN